MLTELTSPGLQNQSSDTVIPPPTSNQYVQGNNGTLTQKPGQDAGEAQLALASFSNSTPCFPSSQGLS